jgi:hypothetical protein
MTWFPKVFAARPAIGRRREHRMNLPHQIEPGNGHGERLIIFAEFGMN